MSTLSDIEVLIPPHDLSHDAAEHGASGFVDCRGQWHAWDEED